jgi:NTP pyrophosphatase (non-canonical NTP hydrolase)
MTKKQFEEITQWQVETFPYSTALSKLHHLRDELRELREAINVGLKKELSLEFADCFFLLFGAAKAVGFEYEDICRFINEKLAINKARNWGKPDENGVVGHIKKDRS